MTDHKKPDHDPVKGSDKDEQNLPGGKLPHDPNARDGRENKAFPTDVFPTSAKGSEPIDASHHPTSTAGITAGKEQPKAGEELKDEQGRAADERLSKEDREPYTGAGSTNRSLGNTAQPFTKENLKAIDEKANEGVVKDTTEAQGKSKSLKDTLFGPSDPKDRRAGDTKDNKK